MATAEDTDVLVAKAAAGDGSAAAALLVRHRGRLRRMVDVRMDKRLRRRFDPSDVVQDVLARASKELPEYLRRRPVAFYPWLRRLAWERLFDLHRKHVEAQARSVIREATSLQALPEDSAYELARRLVSEDASPGEQVLRREMQARAVEALERLPELDREVLVLRFLEGLETAEIAHIVAATEGTVRVRLVRALKKIRALLDPRREDQP